MSQLVRKLAAAVIQRKGIVAASYHDAVHYHILQALICKGQLRVVSCHPVLCCNVAAAAGVRIVTVCCTVVC